jgi:hypothetical protein
VSVQNFSSPNVSNLNISLPEAMSAGSGPLGPSSLHDESSKVPITAIPAIEFRTENPIHNPVRSGAPAFRARMFHILGLSFSG